MFRKALIGTVIALLVAILALIVIRLGYRETTQTTISSKRMIYGDDRPDLAPWSEVKFPDNAVGNCSVYDAWVEPSDRYTAKSIFGYRFPPSVEPTLLVFVLLNIPEDPRSTDRFRLLESSAGTQDLVTIDFRRFWLYSAEADKPRERAHTFVCGERMMIAADKRPT